MALALYAAGGVLMGLGWGGLSWVQHIGAAALGPRPGTGIATMVTINILLPLWAVGVAIYYPRLWTAFVGGPLIMGAFAFTRLAGIDPRFWAWSPGFVKNYTHPIEVAAAIGIAVVGLFVAILIRPLRKVGVEDEDERCECGYLLTGVEMNRCPECGEPIG